MAKIQQEGFWGSKLEPHYPSPAPNTLSDSEAADIFQLIKKKEKRASLIQYKGFAMSRIEKKVRVGSGTFRSGNWEWPQGFAEHYVKAHKVRPSDEFLKFIGFISKN